MSTLSTPSTYSTLIKEQRANIERARASIKAIRANRSILGKIGRLIKARTKREGDSGYVAGWCSDIYINVTHTGLAGFKDQVLKDTLYQFEEAGFDFDSSSENAAEMKREYMARLRLDGTCLYLTVRGYVQSESPTCRRIEVGRTTVEVPKYEVVCA